MTAPSWPVLEIMSRAGGREVGVEGMTGRRRSCQNRGSGKLHFLKHGAWHHCHSQARPRNFLTNGETAEGQGLGRAFGKLQVFFFFLNRQTGHSELSFLANWLAFGELMFMELALGPGMN